MEKTGGQVKRIISCVTKKTSLLDFMADYTKDLETLPSHVFRAEWQHHQVKLCIDTLSNDEACLCMDYAESYQCRFQGEVQSAFFYQNTVTIHPMMAYYTQEIEGKMTFLGSQWTASSVSLASQGYTTKENNLSSSLRT